jgi:hypothetical protein
MSKAGIVLFCLLSIFIQEVFGENQGDSNAPARLRRSESFLGIHFDFHAGADCKEIGKDVNEEMVEYIIKTVRPDYLQCDGKGHPGLSSYPTKVGNQAPGFVKDQLKIWREVTKRMGVALYVHYSGVWDSEAVKKNPQWARVDENGKVDDRITSVFGPYVDELMIPQLKELRDEYGVDGVWVDGDCWATVRDYREDAVKEFLAKTGLEKAPKSSSDAGWQEFTEYCRAGFKKYLAHYVDELHKYDRNFQITSNWSFSSFMPEPVSAEVDFLSGDYTSSDSVRSARFEGRCLAQQGKAWDLMSWSFNYNWSDSIVNTKTATQLKQEAAIVLGLGGGFEMYLQQKRDGSIMRWQIPIAAEVGKFCRARQKFCHKAKSVPQIGLIYSGKAHYRASGQLFTNQGEDLAGIKGILHCLLDGQNVVDIVEEHQLDAKMSSYPLLIYPEWNYIEPEFKSKLIEYINQGGSLLIIGAEAAGLFEKELGIELAGKPEKKVNGLEYKGQIANINSLFQKVTIGDEAKRYGKIYSNNDIGEQYETAATIRHLGKGKIACVYINVGERYLNGSMSACRDFISGMVGEMFAEPIVKVSGSHFVDVMLNQKGDKLMVNLVNTSGSHSNSNVFVFDEIPAVGPLTVSIATKTKPSKVTIEPEGITPVFGYKDNRVQIAIPKLGIHQVICVAMDNK